MSFFSTAGKTLGIVWGICVEILTLIVAIIILTSGNTRFESLVFSLLVLLYLTITSYFMAIGQGEIGKLKTDYSRFKYLRELLKEQISDEDKASEAAEYEQEAKKWKSLEIKGIVRGLWLSVLYLITIFNILRLTVFS